jgi:hypothetical protein
MLVKVNSGMGFPYINIPNATPMALNNKSPRTGIF